MEWMVERMKYEREYINSPLIIEYFTAEDEFSSIIIPKYSQS